MNYTIQNLDPIIRDHVVYAMGAGLIPIPMLDIAAVTVIQLDMLRQLCAKKGVDFNESQGKAWVAALTGSTLSRMAAGAVKIIPGIGSLLGGVTMSVLSGASTYAIGRVAEESLAKGGSIFDFDMKEAKAKYEEAFREGKTAAEDIKRDAETKKPAEEDVYAALEKLGKLRDSGVITAEEFEEKKKKLMEKI
jgi:uncharacterized protein (DUF697 family)